MRELILTLGQLGVMAIPASVVLALFGVPWWWKLGLSGLVAALFAILIFHEEIANS